MALAMARSGAEGKTRAQIGRRLFGDLPEAQVLKFFCGFRNNEFNITYKIGSTYKSVIPHLGIGIHIFIICLLIFK